MKDFLSIALAFISLATLTVVVKNASGSAQVVSATSSGFASVLKTAMGN
jgi:hypothetical protein